MSDSFSLSDVSFGERRQFDKLLWEARNWGVLRHADAIIIILGRHAVREASGHNLKLVI